MNIQEKLAIFDDPLFNFNPKYHAYSYGDKKLISVTKVISSFHEPFNQEVVATKYAEKNGLNKEDVLLEWKEKNEKSIFVGHTVHEFIENYYKLIPQQLPTDITAIKKINSFNIAWSLFLHKLEPVAFEKKIFHVDWGLAGTLDSLFAFNDKYIILDYKSNGEFRDDNHPKGRYNKLLPPFDDLWQNHFNEYSIQVSLYSLILKEIADIDIEKCFLLHLGEEGPTRYQSLDLRERLYDYFTKSKK
jgi:ATP-dependent exoDNAse (exonuclease V) beta subunit